MNSLILFGATLAALLSGSPVFAGTISPQRQCTDLEQQFDWSSSNAEVSSHSNGLVPPVMAARTLRHESARLCKKGDSADGIRDLQQALGDIGVAPAE